MWQYLKPKPATLRVADDRWWELRLTNRVWKESNDFERYGLYDRQQYRTCCC